MIPILNVTVNLGTAGYALFILLLLVGTTNAVNLTDGLDGLAASVTVFVMLAYSAIGFLAGERSISLFSLSIAGSCLGFWSIIIIRPRFSWAIPVPLPLAGAVAAAAIGSHTELLLVIIGGVYVLKPCPSSSR